MPHDVISTCPVCADELSVSRLHCRSCGTTLEGDFSAGRYGRLSREQLAVLESFLRARGNLKDMERELGISYPTVRARVDALVKALGLAEDDIDTQSQELATKPVATSQQRTILERLARHEISAEEASAALASPESD